MREKGLESVGPGHRDREKKKVGKAAHYLRKEEVVQICGRGELCCILPSPVPVVLSHCWSLALMLWRELKATSEPLCSQLLQ